MASRFHARVEALARRALWGPSVLALAALCGPLWPTYAGPQQASVGRLLLIATAVAIGLDLRLGGHRLRRPGWAAAGLIGALALLALWTALNGAVVGCLCAGVAQGFAELVIMTGLAALVALYASPARLTLVLGAAVAGVLAGGLLALVGARDLHAAVYRPSASVDRLEGVYGNPNFLGYALALALPIPVAWALTVRGRRRVAGLAVAAALAALLADTYSRGSLLAAAVGVAVVVVAGFPRQVPRRLRLAAGVLVPALAVVLIASPFYKEKRIAADFGTLQIHHATGLDRSGWSTSAIGPITAAGAVMSNPPPDSAVLAVTTTAPGQGLSYDLGAAFHDSAATWEFTTAATPAVRLRWAVYDRDGPRVGGGTGRVGKTPTPVVVRFPARMGHRYWLFAWSDARAIFALADVTVTERRPGLPGDSRRPVPTRLLGGADALASAEAGYEDARKAAFRMAMRVFADHPIVGIGLGGFADYAQTHDRYGPLPTHDAYTQVLAELGLIGALLLAAAIAVLALSLARGRPPAPLRAAIAGVIAAGGINLVFINGLAAPGNAMPLLLAVAFAVAWAGPAPAWWPRRVGGFHVRDLRVRRRA